MSIKLKDNLEVNDISFQKNGKKYTINEIYTSYGNELSLVYSSKVPFTYDTNYENTFNMPLEISEKFQ